MKNDINEEKKTRDMNINFFWRNNESRCRYACQFILHAHTLTFQFGGNFKFGGYFIIQLENQNSYR